MTSLDNLQSTVEQKEYNGGFAAKWSADLYVNPIDIFTKKQIVPNNFIFIWSPIKAANKFTQHFSYYSRID